MSGYKGDAYTERLAEAAYQRDLANEREPAVLLRDTPEDRERHRRIVRDVLNKWLVVGDAPDDEWDDEADAILAALRGES